ncbi:citrulline utilization hydrolase CtlX [Flavisolibacter tropicus]|uniref:Amidinotransferase n=1 Tax=Flavisolibacter tropicus TaxID=1492898 RepID=A0A172TXQ1_9BACT|nr:arginine deiminase-related protein [Flavisolibacter tropicus]ANE51762.1 amidinotransferase [Flavisolibacter tropicus]
MQITDTVLMIRPAAFRFNEQTAANNFFQSPHTEEVHEQAVQEFDAMVEGLLRNDIKVLVVNDTTEPVKPDAIFPNNWFSTSSEGVVNVYPMYAPNRRTEKRDDILQALAKVYQINNVLDWTEFEAEAMYLEGTGSMVMDHVSKMVYACLSLRTHESLVQKFAAANGYQAITFTATDNKGQLIYHTNVMMCIGDRFAVLCDQAIEDDSERIAVIQLLATTGHAVLPITQEQVNAFAGNMLQVKNQEGQSFIVMSQTAYNVLTPFQIETLQGFGELLAFDVSTIEKVNGGSVRCMMAEIFLQPKE